jgi:hypothetical protein
MVAVYNTELLNRDKNSNTITRRREAKDSTGDLLSETRRSYYTIV